MYIFISSDSIYDVCDPKVRREDFIKEVHSVRPENDKLIDELNENEEYGNDKLLCEEYLISHVSLQDFPYICLRLPDVIGPYDRSARFWSYMKWIQVHDKHPIHINKYTDLRLISLVYVDDVVQVVFKVLEMVKNKDPKLNKILGESFNLCFDQNTTLMNLLVEMAKNLKVKNLNTVDENELISSGKFFYPSVECGPICN